MNQQPDKFFRDKLDNYQRPAPASAWDKIISAERKKKHRAVWLRVAASILPLILAGYILWPIEQPRDSTPLASENNNDKEVIKESTPKVVVDSIKAKQVSPAPQASAPQLAQRTKQSEKSVTHNRKNIPVSNNDKARANEAARSEALPETYEEEAVQSIPVKEDLSVNSVVTEVAGVDTGKKERATITLVYTASDVSQYLDKNNEDDATSSSKKPSALKKLLMKANDLSAQDPFGELRQKKNEILALNFKGKGNVDKTSKQ